ncbi:uncharacterized protein A4U43_C07F19590 [Asparagus officinalis]|uniref:Uncharacterized protein n=1 Tax=Asparagus officinalis TaxID=4686 RepID=A0A5P1EGN2_ASPOF|nr:uncharacterized protein A4U43_C07F19590 [Asparagus officinalis]
MASDLGSAATGRDLARIRGLVPGGDGAGGALGGTFHDERYRGPANSTESRKSWWGVRNWLQYFGLCCAGGASERIPKEKRLRIAWP